MEKIDRLAYRWRIRQRMFLSVVVVDKGGNGKVETREGMEGLVLK